MPRAPSTTRRQDLAHHPHKRIGPFHRPVRSLSLLGNIPSTIAGIATRLFSPVEKSTPVGDVQFDHSPPLPIHTPFGHNEAHNSSPISLFSDMVNEHATFWDRLECSQDEPQPCWIGIQTQTQGYQVHIASRYSVNNLSSFLDMDDAEDDDVYYEAGYDYESDSDVEDDLMDTDTEATSSTNPSSVSSPCDWPTYSWDDEPRSGDDYWDRQTATLCAKHIRDAFPDAVAREKLPLERFIARVLKSIRGSVRDDAAFVALLFLKRIAPTCPLGYYEDMFFISLVLADKTQNDNCHSLRWWSTHCDNLWSIRELHTMERRILQTLDWDVRTPFNCRSSYQSFLAELSSSSSI